MLAEDIQDRSSNATRFVVVASKSERSEAGGKSSLVVYPNANYPGLLLELLEAFAERDINLSRIESRPSGNRLGDYLFHIDADAGLYEERMQGALEEVEGIASNGWVRVLGSYDTQTSCTDAVETPPAPLQRKSRARVRPCMSDRDPFSEIERAFDMLGEQFGVDMGAIPVDVLDKGDAFLVHADLPGYDSEDIDVQLVEDRKLTIAPHPPGRASHGRRSRAAVSSRGRRPVAPRRRRDGETTASSTAAFSRRLAKVGHNDDDDGTDSRTDDGLEPGTTYRRSVREPARRRGPAQLRAANSAVLLPARTTRRAVRRRPQFEELVHGSKTGRSRTASRPTASRATATLRSERHQFRPAGRPRRATV